MIDNNNKSKNDIFKAFEKGFDGLDYETYVNLHPEAAENFTEDAVNHPSHYNSGGVECIEAIKASMGSEQFLGYLKGNVMKYLWRFDKKGKPVEDLEKAVWYIRRLIDEVEEINEKGSF